MCEVEDDANPPVEYDARVFELDGHDGTTGGWTVASGGDLMHDVTADPSSRLAITSPGRP